MSSNIDKSIADLRQTIDAMAAAMEAVVRNARQAEAERDAAMMRVVYLEQALEAVGGTEAD